CQQNNEDPRTF
nr:immunoglobulin light chain junction region [Mus musculus]NSM00056.1 immunoglobulin light chain junction region [Mus musculus]NSM01424.1 immunoglobulin light chain junction region [Mus musculus]